MARYLIRELERVKKRILSLGALVEEQVRMIISAVGNRDADIAQKIIESDWEIDEMEVDVEEECLKILALHQPVAIKENPDRVGSLINLLLISRHLERLADHAENIAEEVIYLIDGEIVRHSKY